MTTNERSGIVMRLAFRAEGEYVNAYHADASTMEGATLLGSMRRSLLDADRELWDTWRELMKSAYRDLIERSTEVKVDFEEFPAPEHERSGRA